IYNHSSSFLATTNECEPHRSVLNLTCLFTDDETPSSCLSLEPPSKNEIMEVFYGTCLPPFLDQTLSTGHKNLFTPTTLDSIDRQ
ncbi:hypothetical protein PanWU01x14_021420, partial [Parasponia andersonii]